MHACRLATLVNYQESANMKERMHRKLKTISTSLKWRNTPLVFQPSNLDPKHHKNLGSEDESKFTSPTSSKEEIIASNPQPPRPEKHEEVLLEYEEKCPPSGKDCIILYSTSLRGIRKTFEDCNAIRFLLGSFRVVYSERDVSMHLEYREELWEVLGGRVVPPRLFIRGRYIGGADEVVGLHEKGMLQKLLCGIPLSPSSACPCRGCGGMRFILCSSCNGSRRVVDDGLIWIRCQHCNENGLIKCCVCS